MFGKHIGVDMNNEPWSTEPARGMGGYYHHLYGLSGANLLRCTREEAQKVAAVPELLKVVEAFIRAFEAHEITNSNSSVVDATGLIAELARTAIAKVEGKEA